MSALPWATDRALDAGMVDRILRRQVPDLRGEVRYLGSGWDNDCYRVGEEWVLRFPRQKEVAERLPVEIAVLGAVAGNLPIPSPVVEIQGTPDEEFPYPFVGYRYLQGVPWKPETAFDVDAVPRQLGEVLSALHRIDPPAIVPPSEWGLQEDLAELRGRKDEVLSVLPSCARSGTMCWDLSSRRRPPCTKNVGSSTTTLISSTSCSTLRPEVSSGSSTSPTPREGTVLGISPCSCTASIAGSSTGCWNATISR
ncbi:MAG TPA: phosphotransferase [Fimbriimonas sp.]